MCRPYPGQATYPDIADRVFHGESTRKGPLHGPVSSHAARLAGSEGKFHLCAVNDLYSGWVADYPVDAHMKSTLAVAALVREVGYGGLGV